MDFLDGLPPMKKRKPGAAVPLKPAGEVAVAEISALKKAFIDRSEKENARYTQAVDSEYWFCVCFQSRAQKDAFLKALGLTVYGDKYLDGARVAHKFGVVLPGVMPTKPLKRPDDKAAALVRDM